MYKTGLMMFVNLSVPPERQNCVAKNAEKIIKMLISGLLEIRRNLSNL